MTAQLYGYRVYLPPDLFKHLHDYKHALQDLLLVGDIVTRPDIAQNDPSLSYPTRQKVARLTRKIDKLCAEIILELRKHLKTLRGPLDATESTRPPPPAPDDADPLGAAADPALTA